MFKSPKLISRPIYGLLMGLSLLCAAAAVFAEPTAALSSQITYQGQLKVSGTPANGTYSFNFACFNAASQGAQIGPTVPVNALAVSNGLISVPLDFGFTAASGQRVWLEVRVSTDGVNFTTLAPRQEITAQFYALHALEAEYALVAGTNSVNSGAIVDGSVSSADLADNSVGSADLAAGSVTGAKIANATITDVNIAGGSILSLSIADGTINTVDLANAAVTNAKLATGAVTAAKIAGNAVTSQEVDSSTVQLRVTGTCAAGNAIQSIGQTGSVTCQSTSAAGSDWSLNGNSGTSDAQFIGTTDNVPMVIKANNKRVARFDPANSLAVGFAAPNVVLGDQGNNVAPGATAASIGGGGGRNGAVALVPNLVYDFGGTVAGGQNNSAGGDDANVQTQAYASVGGGLNNSASNSYATVSGGRDNLASGDHASVPGGFGNTASGTSSLAAGNRAKALHNGALVLADSTAADFASTDANQILLRASGGMAINTNRGIYTAAPAFNAELTIRPVVVNDRSNLQLLNDVGDPYRGFELASANGGVFELGGFYASGSSEPSESILFRANYFGSSGYAKFSFNKNADPIAGAVLQVGNTGDTTSGNGAYLTQGGTWTNGSSRAFKRAFVAVDASAILAKVVALPLSTWNYIDSTEGRHLGPMAEDFAAAFGVGNDNQHIATVDADGVALAAIQGLNAKLDTENAKLAQDNAALRAANAAMDARLKRLEAALFAPSER